VWNPSVIPLLRVNLHMAAISVDQDASVWPSATNQVPEHLLELCPCSSRRHGGLNRYNPAIQFGPTISKYAVSHGNVLKSRKRHRRGNGRGDDLNAECGELNPHRVAQK
jgi:hypothetical protein